MTTEQFGDSATTRLAAVLLSIDGNRGESVRAQHAYTASERRTVQTNCVEPPGRRRRGALTTDANPNPASEATQAADQKLLDTLPFNDRSDFDDAKRGLFARPDTLTIKDADGNVVWGLEEYKKYIADD